MELLKANIPAIIFGLLAATLAFQNVDGWGWFLVPATLTLHTISRKKQTGKDGEDNE